MVPSVNKSQTAFSITYQALGGETLWVFQGSDILALDGTKTLINNGVRESQINLVGASSSAAYDSDGNIKRQRGVYYDDLGFVWRGEESEDDYS